MSEDSSPGLLASIRGLLSTLLAILHTRLQLLGSDLEEQGQRLLQTLVLALLSAVLFVVGMVCTGLLITLWLWETHRLLALGFVLVLMFGGAVLAAWLCRRRLKPSSRPFAASLQELDKDLAALRGDP